MCVVFCIVGGNFYRTQSMRMSRFEWSDWMIKNLVHRVCSVVRFERSRNDDSRTLNVLDEAL